MFVRSAVVGAVAGVVVARVANGIAAQSCAAPTPPVVAVHQPSVVVVAVDSSANSSAFGASSSVVVAAVAVGVAGCVAVGAVAGRAADLRFRSLWCC